MTASLGLTGRTFSLGLLGLAGIAVAYIAGIAEPNERPSGNPDFLSPGAELEVLVDGAKEDLTFTEGVVVTCDRRILFSDLSAGEPAKHGKRQVGVILEYHPDSQTISVFRSPSGGANGNRMDLACNLLTAERHRLVRTDMATGRAASVLDSDESGSYDGLNDIAVDSSGRIYVTHPRYGATHPDSVREPGVYRVNADGSVTVIITDAAKPNGIAICPDEAHIYVGSFNHEAETDREMALLRYDLASDGSAANRQVLVDYTPRDGPDGLVCDTEGNLWVAVRDRSRQGIYIYSVADRIVSEQAYIPTPELPTNVHFGRGDDSDYLYITAGNSLYGIRVGKRGHHLQRLTSAIRSRPIACPDRRYPCTDPDRPLARSWSRCGCRLMRPHAGAAGRTRHASATMNRAGGLWEHFRGRARDHRGGFSSAENELFIGAGANSGG